MIQELQEHFDIYLVTRHAPSDYPPTYITCNSIMFIFMEAVGYRYRYLILHQILQKKTTNSYNAIKQYS